MNDRTLLEMFRKIVYQETIYLRHYYAKVVSVEDEEKRGRIRVACYDLGMDTGTSIMASPRFTNSITLPKVDDWVEIYFMLGDRTKAVWMNVASDFDLMNPENFDGKATTHILFEDPDNKIHEKFDAEQNVLEIGNSDMQFVARENDSVKVTIGVNGLTGFTAGGYPVINVAPLDLTGTITSGSDQIKVGKK